MKIQIINSKGHWQNGWLSTPDELQVVLRILQEAGVDVHSVEVESVTELEKVLDGLSHDTLVWSNAYFVNDGLHELVWLNDHVEARRLPLLGSGAQTLRNLLQKNVCQAILQQGDLPTPQFAVFTAGQSMELRSLLAQSGVGFPMVLKPTAEAGSVGVAMAGNLEEATEHGLRILTDFPQGNLIIEEFLPSDDITCGFLELDHEVLLLPTSYIVRSMAGNTHILSRKQRLRSWDDEDKIQTVVTDPSVLAQLKDHIPAILEALKIRNITRVDGRLDSNGTLRFFDVNGLPALSFPDGVLVKQCFTCFPGYSREEVFEALIHTLVYSAALHYGIRVPEAMRVHHLLNMESDAAIRLEYRPCPV